MWTRVARFPAGSDRDVAPQSLKRKQGDGQFLSVVRSTLEHMFDMMDVLTDAEIHVRCAELDAADQYPVGPADDPAAVEPNSGSDGDGRGVFDDAARLCRTDPDARLMWLLDTAELAEVSDYGVVEVVAGWERLIAHAMARQAEAIAALADRPCMQGSIGPDYSSLHQDRVTALEIAARLGWSPGIADRVVDQGLLLTGPLCVTRDALAAGLISTRHARVIIDELGPVCDDVALVTRIQRQALSTLDGVTPAMLRAKLKRILGRLAPDRVKQTARRARADREVTCRPLPNGMAVVEAFLPAEDAAALMATVDAAAVAARLDNPHDPRTLPQLRADALAEVGWTALATGYLTGDPAGPRLARTRNGEPVTVHVTLFLATLLGLDDQPGELAGYGPIDADTARRLATGGTWRRLVTDPLTGTVLDVGRTTYRPPADLAEHIIWRDRDCVAPGCAHPAESCDIDHTVPYPKGPTANTNLGLLCRRHHLVKHHTRWRLQQPEPGHFQWTSPTGHTYLTTPEGIGPIIADEPAPPPAEPFPDDPAPPDDEPDATLAPPDGPDGPLPTV
jgi:hypothetical protein